MSNRCVFLLFALFAAPGLLGCDQKTSISGAVTYNGQPVEKGAISFQPTGGKGRSFGAQVKDGRYEAIDAMPGKWKAVVLGAKKIDFGMSTDEAVRKAEELKAKGGPLAGHVAEAAYYIAEDAEGNSREVEIAKGKQTIDFAITGPPRE